MKRMKKIDDKIIRRKKRSIDINMYRSPGNRRYLEQMNEKRDYTRLFYGICCLTLIVVEILIAMFVQDEWIRPYMGDILIVIVLYTFIRTMIPHGLRILPVLIFAFACMVEGLQAIHIVDKLGLGNVEFFRILLGTVGDWKDIICYAIGCSLLILYEMVVIQRLSHYE